MKKICTLFLIVLLLCGCSEYNNDSFRNRMNEFLNNLSDGEIFQNNYSYLFNYFLPSDMVEKEFDDSYVVIEYLKSKIIMNVNISAIVNKYNYHFDLLLDDGFISEDKCIYKRADTFKNVNNVKINYNLKVYDYDSKMLLNLYTDDVNIYAYSLKEEAIMTAMHMVTLARGVTINEERVLLDYESHNIFDDTFFSIDLFSYIIPEEGNIDDLLK